MRSPETRALKKKHSNRKLLGSSVFSRFTKDESGSYAILAAAVLPVAILGGMYGVDAYYTTMRVQQFDNYVRTACYRAAKPTRTNIVNDFVRQGAADTLFKKTIPTNQYDNIKTKVNVDWLDISTEATATFKPLLGIAAGSDPVSVSAKFQCNGIPPYPHDGEVVLSTNLTNEEGDTLPLPQGRPFRADGCWGIAGFDHKTIGWSGSQGYALNTNKPKGPGTGQIEIQYWGEDKVCWNPYYEGATAYPDLPEDVTSNYAIELDAYNNNEIWRDVELHPGQYMLSMNYWGRPRGQNDIVAWENSLKTNGIGIYTQKLRPKKGNKKQVVLAQAAAKEGWVRYIYKFEVDEYSIYTFFVKGEGDSDTYGGIFNDFKLIYLDDLKTGMSSLSQDDIAPYGVKVVEESGRL